MRPARVLTPIVAALPGGVLAVLGLTHPQYLTASTARYWTDLHYVLVALFPLLGVVVWFVLRGVAGGVRGVVAWLARIAAFVYVAFYGAIDAIDGIGAGTVRQTPGHVHSDITALYSAGERVGMIGAWGLVVAVVLTLVALAPAIRRHPAQWAIGGVLVIVAALVYRTAHIFPPVGVSAMLAFAVGFALLEHTAAATRRTRS